MSKKNKILKDLESIFEKKVKEKDDIKKFKNFDSITILQIINLAKIKYKRDVDGITISKCKTISEIINNLI